MLINLVAEDTATLNADSRKQFETARCVGFHCYHFAFIFNSALEKFISWTTSLWYLGANLKFISRVKQQSHRLPPRVHSVQSCPMERCPQGPHAKRSGYVTVGIRVHIFCSCFCTKPGGDKLLWDHVTCIAGNIYCLTFTDKVNLADSSLCPNFGWSYYCIMERWKTVCSFVGSTII